MKKKLLIFLPLLLVAFVICDIYFINYTPKENSFESTSKTGIVAKQGDWVYYAGDGLYKMKMDGTEEQKLAKDDYCDSVKVVGDWVYYAGDGLFKIKTDGTGRKKIGKDMAYHMNVADDWIYYTDGMEGPLYKIKTDGTGRKKIGDDEASSMTVVGDWIYYTRLGEPFYWDEHYDREPDKLYKMKTDGTENQKLCNDDAKDLNVVGNWMYYIANNRMYKIKTDGTERKRICNEEHVYTIDVVGKWIYYCSEEDSSKIRKIKVDGSKKTTIGKGVIFEGYSFDTFIVLDDWIYFTDTGEMGDGFYCDFYRMRTDGTGKKKITGWYTVNNKIYDH